MLAVVLSFDEFPLRLLGCYGNSTVEMPCLNQIAAESIVFDQHFGEDFSATPEGHAWWSGCYHFPRQGTQLIAQMPSLPRLLALGNVESHWLAEKTTPEIAPLPNAAPVTVLKSFAEIIRRGCELLGDWSTFPESRQLLWLKAGRFPGNGFSLGPWGSAENASAMRYVDSTILPLWKTIRELAEQRRVLFILTSARGRSLGERAGTATSEAEWAEESVHLPLIAHHSGIVGGERRSALTQTMDLPATLHDFFALGSTGNWEGESFFPALFNQDQEGRDCLTSGDHGVWESLRTRRFHWVRLLNPEHSEESRPLLFMKPDDVWDTQDVSAQEPEMTETLAKQMDAFLTAAKTQVPILSPASQLGRREEETVVGQFEET